MPTPPNDRPGLFAQLRSLLADVLELAQVRLALLGIDAREAGAHLLAVALFAVAATLLLVLGLGFLAVFIVVLLWDGHRLLALGLCTAFFLLGSAALAWLAAARARQSHTLFAATRQELARDRERLNP